MSRWIEILSRILLFVGGVILYSTMFIPEGEELNLQHFLLGVASITLFCGTLLIVCLRKYTFDFIDVSVIIAYIYLILLEAYGIHIFNSPNTYTLLLLFVVYFVCRIMFYYFELKCMLICLLAFFAIFQSLIGVCQFLGVLDSRHSVFLVTGTYLNSGPFGTSLAIIGVIVVLYVVSNFSLFKGYQQKDIIREKKDIFFLPSYYLSLVASISIIIMLALSESRSALFGFCIPISIFILKTKCIGSKIKDLIYKKTLTAIVLLSILVVGTMFYYIRPESVNGRLHIWKVSLSELDNSVIAGKGIGTFSKQYIIAQENFYIRHGIDSEWVKYADTPSYAFNEYINITYEVGIIGLLLFIYILYLIIKRQIYSYNNQIFAYGITSILLISFTSYPLHLISISVVFVVLMAIRDCDVRGIIPYKFTLLILLCIFIFTSFRLPDYFATVDSTIKWGKIKHYSDLSVIEVREEGDFLELYDYLADNDRFLLDYARFLKNKRNYSKSIVMLEKGYKTSNNPDFVLLLADIHFELGNECEAEWYYKKAFMMVPNRLSPLYLLANFYYDTGQYVKFRCLANYIANFDPKVKSNRTDRMKKDISDLLDMLNEDQLEKSVSE